MGLYIYIFYYGREECWGGGKGVACCRDGSDFVAGRGGGGSLLACFYASETSRRKLRRKMTVKKTKKREIGRGEKIHIL